MLAALLSQSSWVPNALLKSSVEREREELNDLLNKMYINTLILKSLSSSTMLSKVAIFSFLYKEAFSYSRCLMGEMIYNQQNVMNILLNVP